MDNLEWIFGHEPKFGLCRTDVKTLERTPKMSAHWFRALSLAISAHRGRNGFGVKPPPPTTSYPGAAPVACTKDR